MSDVNVPNPNPTPAATPAPAQPPVPPAPADQSDALLSVREAARTLAARRQELARQAQEPPKEEAEATTAEAPTQPPAPQQEPPVEPSGETTEPEPESEELQSIEPPASWTAEAREAFAQLPPNLQHYVSERENQRDTEVRRRQQEVADYMRQVQPEVQAMLQARAQYEAALPALLQAAQSTGEFADIRTIDDVERLAKEDWPRYVQYDAHQKKVAAIAEQQQAAQQRQAQEYVNNWTSYAAEQDRMFAERVPEFANPERAQELQHQALQTLENDYGFSLPEMQAGWAGAFRDHRIQQMILDATRYRQLMKNKPVPARNLPPVQRPGVARGPEAAEESSIKALDQQVNALTGVKQVRAAAQLLSARRAQRR